MVKLLKDLTASVVVTPDQFDKVSLTTLSLTNDRTSRFCQSLVINFVEVKTDSLVEQIECEDVDCLLSGI